MESQAITRFQTFSTEEITKLQNLLATYFQPCNVELKLYSHLVQWKHKHNKCKYFRREGFIEDGFNFNVQSSSHSILYIFDYKYDNRQTRRRLYKMQEFISKHCFDSEIKNYSTSTLILNKTNSLCINTESYVKRFSTYIIKEIEILHPSAIVCMGTYDIVSKLFKKYKNNEILSAIKYIPIIDMLPPNIKVNDKIFQLHWEFVWFSKFRLEHLKEVYIKLKNKLCPICNKPIIGYPAISRKDNKTEICSDCGTLEALTIFMNYQNESRCKNGNNNTRTSR